ncbi:MAG: hypothetical protein AAFQ84_12600, partial [Pseudomonadota bacterium]
LQNSSHWSLLRRMLRRQERQAKKTTVDEKKSLKYNSVEGNFAVFFHCGGQNASRLFAKEDR